MSRVARSGASSPELSSTGWPTSSDAVVDRQHERPGERLVVEDLDRVAAPEDRQPVSGEEAVRQPRPALAGGFDRRLRWPSIRSRRAPLESTLQVWITPSGSLAMQSVKVPPVSIQICQGSGHCLRAPSRSPDRWRNSRASGLPRSARRSPTPDRRRRGPRPRPAAPARRGIVLRQTRGDPFEHPRSAEVEPVEVGELAVACDRSRPRSAATRRRRRSGCPAGTPLSHSAIFVRRQHPPHEIGLGDARREKILPRGFVAHRTVRRRRDRTRRDLGRTSSTIASSPTACAQSMTSPKAKAVWLCSPVRIG